PPDQFLAPLDLGIRRRDRGLAPTLLAAAFQPSLTHQPGDPPATDGDAAMSQRLTHSRRTVGAARLGVDLADRLEQLGIRPRPGRGCIAATLVVGGTGDLEQLTAPLDAVTCSLLRLDEGIDLHRVSLAKKPVARLRVSPSSRRRRFSRRNSVSSRHSALDRPSRLPSSTSAWRT